MRKIWIFLVLLLSCLIGLYLYQSRKAAGKYNIILMVLDTTRPDHLSCYGYDQPTTPYIDEVAREAVLFTQATSVIPLTTPSHTSLMTGLHPGNHMVFRNAHKIDSQFEMMAEILKRAGYMTAGFVSTRLIGSKIGFDQGFDFFSDVPPEQKEPRRRGDQTVEEVLPWLAENSEKRFFLWVHLYDPHLPYNPPKAFGLRFNPNYQKEPGDPGYLPDDHTDHMDFEKKKQGTGERPKRLFPALPGKLSRKKHPEGRSPKMPIFGKLPFLPGLGFPREMPPDQVKRMKAAYDGEIAFVDAQLSRIFELLKAKGIYQKTIIVIMGDHGEILYEKAHYFGHHRFLYQGSVRIPLIMKFPGIGHQRIQQRITQMDVLPTLLDAIDIHHEAELDGISYLPLIQQKGEVKRPVYEVLLTHSAAPLPMPPPMRQDRKAKGAPARNPGMPFGPKKRVNKFNQWFPKVAIVKDHWKFHKDLFYEGNDELYHLKEDPGEQKDLYDTAKGRTALADLETELKAYLDSRKDVGSKGEIPKSDPSTLRDLKSLGYVE